MNIKTSHFVLLFIGITLIVGGLIWLFFSQSPNSTSTPQSDIPRYTADQVIYI